MAYTTLTPENFEEFVQASGKAALVDFWAPWCSPCKMMAPVFEQLAELRQGEMAFGKVNMDDFPALAERYQVSSIPTLVLLKEGKELDRKVGFVPLEELEQWLSE